MVIETITGVLSALNLGLDKWKQRAKEDEKNMDNKNAAIDLVLAAVQSTRAYKYGKDVLLETDRKEERKFSEAWAKAGAAIREYDEQLFFSSHVKSLG